MKIISFFSIGQNFNITEPLVTTIQNALATVLKCPGILEARFMHAGIKSRTNKNRRYIWCCLLIMWVLICKRWWNGLLKVCVCVCYNVFCLAVVLSQALRRESEWWMKMIYGFHWKWGTFKYDTRWWLHDSTPVNCSSAFCASKAAERTDIQTSH